MIIRFPSGGLTLEGHAFTPARCTGAAVLCHPHPQYGGDMDNTVVVAAAQAFQDAGYATLRFNFRGVGGSAGAYSSGRGEGDDARAAVHWLLERTGGAAVTLAGYSFGAMVALQQGPALSTVDRLVAIAPPLAFFNLEHLATCTKPMLFIIGDSDQYCSVAQFTSQLAHVGGTPHHRIVHGADHFLTGVLGEVGQAITEFASAA